MDSNSHIPSPPAYGAPAQPLLRVTVVDFEMTFGHLVGFFVKAAIAMIPAAIILIILGVVIAGVLGGLVHH